MSKQKQTNLVGKVFSIILCVFIGIALVIDLGWIYWKFFTEKPTTTNVVYAQSITDQFGNEESIIKLNCYTNVNNTGEPMLELQLTYYTDAFKNAVAQSTIQMTFEKVYLNGLYAGDVPKLTYYSGGFGKHFVPLEEIQRNEPMYVEIDGEMYSFCLDKTYRELLRSVNVGKMILGGLNELFGGYSGKDYGYDYYYGPEKEFTFKDLMQDAWTSLINTSEGYGDFNLYLVDFSKYFTFYKYNENTQQDDPYQADANFVRNYFSVEAHVDRFGVTKASQSLVNMFEGDATYNTSGVGAGQEYWSSRVNYYLTNDNFELRNSSLYGGYLLSLKQDTFAELSKYDCLNIYITINLDDFRLENKNVVGFDEYALFGFNVNDIKIISSKSATIKFLNYSLYDTEIKTITYSSTVSISFEDDAINSTYSEVII